MRTRSLRRPNDGVGMSAESSQCDVQTVVSDSRAEPELLHMVRRHYDTVLMHLHGEIHFDATLSRAEIEVAERVYGQPIPQLAYLPCCGTLRHALPLLERGVEHLLAADLSLPSLTAGLTRNVPEALRDKLSVYHTDVRCVSGFLPSGGVRFAFLGGNSLGDITDVEGHVEFIASLAASLAPGGVLVFDYVGERYAPGAQDAVTEWPEVCHGATGDIAVLDRRTRQISPVSGTAMSVLAFTCEVRDVRTGEPVVLVHSYDKLVVPEILLVQQFADAGLELTNIGGVAELSLYHRERIRRRGDLGMLGEPDCFYRAVKM